MSRLYQTLMQEAGTDDISYPKHNPAKLEKRLRAKARKKHLKGERFDAYVYGSMRKTGWKPSRER